MNLFKLILGVAGIIGSWIWLFYIGNWMDLDINVKVFCIGTSILYSIFSEKNFGIFHGLVREGVSYENQMV